MRLLSGSLLSFMLVTVALFFSIDVQACASNSRHHNTCPRVKHQTVKANYGYPLIYCKYYDNENGTQYEKCFEERLTSRKVQYFYHDGCRAD